MLSQEVEAQTILRGVNLVNQALAELGPLGRVHQALEDGLLYALAKVAAFLGNMAEPLSALGSLRIHVVGNDNKHKRLISRAPSREKQEARIENQEARINKQEPRSKNQEARSKNREARIEKQESRSKKEEATWATVFSMGQRGSPPGGPYTRANPPHFQKKGG
jgi:hypothetical protein